ncbi:MAG: DUF4011 domain-containing protein [Clostridia bacterium]|jgi:hypothetical protein|nr:DUF4011 domain-containing protein [Clostridia bacterium]
MAAKQKNALKDKLTVELRFPKYVGFSDYYLATPITVQIKNEAAEAVTLNVTAESADGLFAAYEAQTEVPFESSVELNAEIFSPLFLAENDELRVCPTQIVISHEGEEVMRKKANITALPFDWWEGLEGNAERLASFVRPRVADCSPILSDTGSRLKKWKADAEFYGYTGTDKNAVRQIAAAVFAAIKSRNIEKAGETDLSSPVAAAKETSILKSKSASALQLALFAAACLEAVHLHPVIAVGKKNVGVGVWLYDSCFLDTVTDDKEIIGKYISEGINNLSFFDVDDLFGSKNAAFTPSETHFRHKLKENLFEYFIDIRRCRMGGVHPLPLRGKSVNGYELLKDEDLSDEKAPAPLPVFKKLALEGKQSKNKQWERRLLDLTGKNALLNFSGKNALHLYSADADKLLSLLSNKELKLKAQSGAVKTPEFGAELKGQQKELTALEQKKGFLRTYHDAKTTSEIANKLLKRNRDAVEETGSKILYLAFGFLKYKGNDDGKANKYAPLVLAPAVLGRAKGNEDFSVKVAEGEYFVNSTLLEYLKQEFNIDVRGLGGDVSSLKIKEILAMVRAETANMKGWDVVTDVYLATYSFQRFLMWNEIKNDIAEFKKNRIVASLLNNRLQKQEFAAPVEEDDGDPEKTLLPLPSDSSQYSAVSLSGTGASFVLHGPPGTGKSQTITNIIANALASGKRVLFVAEKKAALDVVKKRLDGVGIGDFCLEIHSNKTDKYDVLRRMEQTLSLAGKHEECSLEERARELVSLREELRAPMKALHKKRRLGVSVYQAIILYLQNKSAPDIMDVESSFYDSLTENKLIKCKNMILSAAAAAKECGGVSNSPFKNVNLYEYTQEARDRIFCACEVLIAEIRHLKSFLALLLEFYRQKVSKISEKKIRDLTDIAMNLADGVYDKYFDGVSEEDFYIFYNANKRLDTCLEYYKKHFKMLVEPEMDLAELAKVCEDGADWKLSKHAKNLVKRLQKAGLHSIEDEDVPKYLQTVHEIYSAIDRIASKHTLSKSFCSGGKINYKRRKEFLAELDILHEKCAYCFLDYNADAFNGMCIRAANGYTLPVLEGYIKAAESFFTALDSFYEATHADRDKLVAEDILDYYSTKASSLIDNIDMLPNWCMYKNTTQKLGALGLNFIADALEGGRLKGENILAGFEKNVYKNFLEINIPADPNLSRMTVGTLEDSIEKFRLACDEFCKLTRDKIREKLIARLPKPDSEGSLSVELAAFARFAKSNLRGTGLRAMFTEIPTLAGVISPCLLMSPIAVAQYLAPVANSFDLVIFDEASQMSTAEAIGSIARAKSVIVVGDPKQLPPTSFFNSNYVDEENLDNEDLESVLDDCLALGMPERHLEWHYRSKHESLIAFSNSMYYDNRLCTFPSPDGLESKVKLVEVDGSYDRGFTKRNRKEAEALVKEVIRRLSDPVLSRSSMGVVTFSGAQQEDIDRLLTKAIASHKLESVAYEREEPIFVKNLENVQGDERDVILFSVCYGPDSAGRLSLNFGPLNQTGGWRRLNVAVSRAREEMIVFSTMKANMINLQKTSSKGVAGLKAFLEFAERGRTTLAVKSDSVRSGSSIGKFIAQEIEGYGYECRYNVGASDFKVDVAVVDPRNKHRFVLGIVCDGTDKFSVKDRNVLQMQTLKRGNWNVMRLNTVNYFNNPKREIKHIKEMLDKLTGAEKKTGSWISKYQKPYRAVAASSKEEQSTFVTGGANDTTIMARLKEIVATEEPISRAFLKKRCLASFGIIKSGTKVDSRLDSLIDACGFAHDRVNGFDYYYKNARAITVGKFRTDDSRSLRKTEEDFTVYEILSLVKGALEERVALYMDELLQLVSEVFREVKINEKFSTFVRDCVGYGEEKGLFVRSVSDRISLA